MHFLNFLTHIIRFIILFACFELNAQTEGRSILVSNGQLYLNSEEAPLLYGAEIEYSKLRGGPDKNIPQKTVIDLWARVLDRAIESGINSVSFTIPWDFHEYAEGSFDFNGSADEDKDGNPDYPSRDLNTFLKMIDARGIKTVLIKPGPFINSNWGFADIGAVPLWFHKKYPDAHVKNSAGFKLRTYELSYEPFLKAIHGWFVNLHSEVLKNHIGFGKVIKFIQLDSESNIYQQSLYSQDYSLKSIKKFQTYLKEKYIHINNLNRSYFKSYLNFEEVRPPTQPGSHRSLEKDWYEYQENNYLSFLEKIKKIWEDLDVKDKVIFTNEDSNSSEENTILNNYFLRNSQSKNGLLSLNIKTKSYDIEGFGINNPNHNLPYKVDLDTKLENVASQTFFGFKNNWVLGSGLQGASSQNFNYSYLAKKQTYLSALGHGMKAMFISSFVEGWSYDWDWKYNEIDLIKKDLKIFSDILNEEQYSLIQNEFDKRHFIGLNVKESLLNRYKNNGFLSNFDGPLDVNGKPRESYLLIKEFGQKVIQGFGKYIAKSKPIEDEVVIWRDVFTPIKNWTPDLNIPALNVDWTGGLLGMLLQSKVNPAIAMKNIDFLPLSTAKIVFCHDSGQSDNNTAANIKVFLRKGGTVVNFIGTSLMKELGVKATPSRLIPETKVISLNYSNIVTQPIELPVLSSPIYTYQIPSECTPKLTWKSKPVAFSCPVEGGTFIQVGALLHEDINSSFLSSNQNSSSLKMRQIWYEGLMRDSLVIPKLKWGSDHSRVAVFSRYWEEKKTADSTTMLQSYFIVVKNFENMISTVRLSIPKVSNLPTRMDDTNIIEGYEIIEMMSLKTIKIPYKEFIEGGYLIKILPQSAEGLIIKPYVKTTEAFKIKK